MERKTNTLEQLLSHQDDEILNMQQSQRKIESDFTSNENQFDLYNQKYKNSKSSNNLFDLMEPTNNTNTYQTTKIQLSSQNSDLLGMDLINKDDTLDYKATSSRLSFDIQYPEIISQNSVTSYKLYKIKSSIDGGQTVIVNRRFSDFQFFQIALIQNYGGWIIPMLPQKNFWTCLNLQGKEYIEYRLKRLKKYITKLWNNPKIQNSHELQAFLTNQKAFSYLKGEHEQKKKLEDKFYSILQSTLGIGQNLIEKVFPGLVGKENSIIIRRNEHTVLTKYQEIFISLTKAIKNLKQDIVNRNKQKQLLKNVQNLLKNKEIKLFHKKVQEFPLMEPFEDLSEYINSCVQALNRRNRLAYEIESLKNEEEKNLKKSKPRSVYSDVLEKKIKTNTQKLQKWTANLKGELEIGSATSKKMLDAFLTNYIDYRRNQYNFQ